jgi:ribosomal protein L37AE/L43A
MKVDLFPTIRLCPVCGSEKTEDIEGSTWDWICLDCGHQPGDPIPSEPESCPACRKGPVPFYSERRIYLCDDCGLSWSLIPGEPE